MIELFANFLIAGLELRETIKTYNQLSLLIKNCFNVYFLNP